MANEFSKEERVAFDSMVESFSDGLVLSKQVGVMTRTDQEMERTNDTVWVPMPYIARSYDGRDQTDNFKDVVQLSVPASVNYQKSVPFYMTPLQLRDAIQRDNYAEAGRKKLASEINLSVMDAAANQGTLVVKRTAAAAGFDDLAEADAMLNEQGIPMGDRSIALSSRDYNRMAGNLASRTLEKISADALRKGYVGQELGFDTFKLDYANSLTAKTAASVTINGANQYYVPKATDGAQAGRMNVDNRYQTLALTVGSGALVAGDCFTIADVYAVHHITKRSTGQLKTFRVISGPVGGGSGNYVISPAIISNGGASPAETQYQNVNSTPASGATVTLLNTVTASVNPFWHKDSIDILPARYVVQEDCGLPVLYGSTEQGIQIALTRQGDINTLNCKYRLDCYWGTVMKQPEMAGIMLFSQS